MDDRGAGLGTGLVRRDTRDVVAIVLQVIPVISRSTPWSAIGSLQRGCSLGYEYHHQQNLKTMRGAKSKQKSSSGTWWNRDCPCIAPEAKTKFRQWDISNLMRARAIQQLGETERSDAARKVSPACLVVDGLRIQYLFRQTIRESAPRRWRLSLPIPLKR